MTWDRRLDAAVSRVTGPEDEVDEEVNGDPDSTLGEDDEEGFDDDPFGVEPLFVEDDGLDDAEGEDDDEGEAEDDED